MNRPPNPYPEHDKGNSCRQCIFEQAIDADRRLIATDEKLRKDVADIVLKRTLSLLGSDLPKKYKPDTLYGRIVAGQILALIGEKSNGR